MGQRTGAVAVSDRGQPVLRRLGAEGDLAVAEPGGGHQQRTVEDLLVQLAHPAAGSLVAGGELLGGHSQGAARRGTANAEGGSPWGRRSPGSCVRCPTPAREAEA